MATIAHKHRGVCFDSSVDPEEEDRRTARGIKSRRERKERKKMTEKYKEGRMKVTAKILMDPDQRQKLVALCGRDERVAVCVSDFVDEYIETQNHPTLDGALSAFHQQPGLTVDTVAANANVREDLEFLGLVSGEFQDKFKILLKAAAVTSGSEEEDAGKEWAKKKTKYRQVEANHRALHGDDEGPPAGPAEGTVVRNEPPGKALDGTQH